MTWRTLSNDEMQNLIEKYEHYTRFELILAAEDLGDTLELKRKTIGTDRCIIELMEERKRAQQAERVGDWYRTAFTWLQEQQWFQEKQYLLKKFINQNDDQTRDRSLANPY